jgi:AcrR family transcriptional regulator
MGAAGKGRPKGPALLNGEASAGEAPRRRQPVRKLKPGPGLSAPAVFADQRRRLRAATIELVGEHGYENVTVRALSKHAGVSTRTFYRHFANAADCLGFACESTMQCALRRMEEASSGADDWEGGLRALTASVLTDFGSHPDAASVTLIEAFAGGSSVLIRMRAMFGTLEQLLADLVSAAPQPVPVPRRLVGGMVAGLLRVARSTTLAGRAEELPGLSSNVSEWMLAILALSRDGEFGPFAVTGSGGSRRRESKPFPDGGRLGDEDSIGDERQRILRATVRLATSDGLSGLTIPRIRRGAGVSRRSFDSHFESLTECFLDSLEWLATSAAARAEAWAGTDADPDRRTRRLLLALCAQAARNDALANLVFVGILDAGREGLVRREHLVTIAAAGVREDLPPVEHLGDLALGASVAAVWETARAEVASGRAKRLPGLSPLLAHLILAPTRASEGSFTAPGKR